MRVLICGGRRVETTTLVVSNGFRRVGCEVFNLPTRDYDNPTETSRFGPLPDLKTALEKALREHKIDVVVWIMCKADCPPGFIAYTRLKFPAVTFVYHTFDDPFEADRTGNPLAADFDYAITCCEGSLQHYARMGTPAICLYPPYDEEIHGNAHPEEEFDCDFSLVATNLYPKSRFPKVLVERSQLARLMVGMGSARFYGPWDKRHGWGGEFGVPDLKSHWHGFLKFDRLAALFVSTKINVNTHVRPDGYRYLNERTCLLLGAGAFMMCDRVAGLEEWSDNERRFVLFSSLDEFVEKARYYLDRPKERAEIAARGQAFAEDRFSSTAFARDLCRFVGRPMEPARTEPTTTAPSLDHPPSAAVSGG